MKEKKNSILFCVHENFFVITFYLGFGYDKAKSSGSDRIRIHNTAFEGTWIAQASMYRYMRSFFGYLIRILVYLP
jgi:hypothetical protein